MGLVNPLDALDHLVEPVPTPITGKSVALAARIGIPKEDLALFDTLVNDPKLTDITQEMAYLRYLRVKLQQSIEARRDAMVIELGRRFLEAFDEGLWSNSCPVSEESKSTVREWMRQTIQRLLNEHFPILDLDRSNAAALRDMVTALGKMASEWKKVTEGITVKIESNEDELFLRLIRDILIPSVPRHLWVDILTRAESLTKTMAPALPEGVVEYLG